MIIHHRPGLDLEAILDAVNAPGETIKASHKSVTRRVGSWVIKETASQTALATLKLTILRERYRRGWAAGNFLQRYGVLVPTPHAFIERGGGVLIHGNTLVSDYLDGCINVEEYARQHVSEENAGPFLDAIADAVNALVDTGAYHSDLSGKNIFTPDGKRIYFIDLDGVTLKGEYPNRWRMKNHVQLYDSFCDLWPPECLDAFILRMLPVHLHPEQWLERVHKGQAARRQRHIKRAQRAM